MPLLPLLLWYAAAARPPVSDPLEAPVVAGAIRVRQEANGQCAEVDAGLSGRAPLIRMTNICHGWSTQSCATILLIKVQGVVEDAAEAVFLRANRKANLVALIDAEIGRVWPGDEHLHLVLTRVDCVGGRMAVTFEGSHVRKNASASAYGMRGVITVSPEGRAKISIRAAQ
jgi:hypothetical protein